MLLDVLMLIMAIAVCWIISYDPRPLNTRPNWQLFIIVTSFLVTGAYTVKVYREQFSNHSTKTK